MSETLSQIIAKMGTPAKPTGSTPKVPKEDITAYENPTKSKEIG